MEKKIRDRYNDEILSQTLERYALSQAEVRSLGGFESYIYEFEKDGRPYILRVGHSLRRAEALICGEVDWLNHLARGGAGVARAVESAGGRLVEAVEDRHGGHFLATAFVKALGKPPFQIPWDELFLERYGRLLGRIHALSRAYKPSEPAWRRFQWDDPAMLDVEKWLPADDRTILERYRHLRAYLNTLPKPAAAYGLIHQDPHAGNFFVDDDGRLTLFDFDDCCYSWFVYDIAMVVFYAITNRPDAAEYTGQFLPSFLRGYREEFPLEANWLAQIPHFLKLREIDLYAVIHRSMDVDNLENPWVAAFMEGRRERLIEDIPYVDFDFASVIP